MDDAVSSFLYQLLFSFTNPRDNYLSSIQGIFTNHITRYLVCTHLHGGCFHLRILGYFVSPLAQVLAQHEPVGYLLGPIGPSSSCIRPSWVRKLHLDTFWHLVIYGHLCRHPSSAVCTSNQVWLAIDRKCTLTLSFWGQVQVVGGSSYWEPYKIAVRLRHQHSDLRGTSMQ